MFSPTLRNKGVGRRRSRRDGALAGDRPETEGTLREGTWKAWPLLFRASSHPLGVQSEYGTVGHTGTSRGNGGVVRFLRFVSLCF
jgi:hypothetical protein